MPIDPFDPQLLSDYEHLARLYPGLDLKQFRLLWQEAGEFMHDALERGYEPEEVPALFIAETVSIVLIPSRPENRPPGTENGPRRLENKPRSID